MLILTCIIILKKRGLKYRGLSAILVALILFLLIFLIKKVYNFFSDRNNVGETEEWIDIQGFSNTLEMKKIGKLNSYPQVTLLSDIDGEIMSLNVTTGDIVEEYQILMNIKSADGNISDYDVGEVLEDIYSDYDDVEYKYKQFQLEYGEKIKQLETQLYNDQNSLVQAMEFNDKETQKILKKEIEKISDEYNSLKSEQDYLKNKLNSLDSEAKQVLNESDKYFYESEKQTPRAPFNGVVGGIYINEGEVVRNGDQLISIINNNFTPEISVSLDFDEYLLTKDLTGVDIIIENENWGDLEYEGEIYTRSPILNDEGKYTITVKIIDENVPDLILNDENSVIKIVFRVNSESEWIPSRCFKRVGKNNGVLVLRDWLDVSDEKVNIKSKWENWINVDIFSLYSLEKDKQKDGIDLYTIEVLCNIE